MAGSRQIEIRPNRDAQPRAYIAGTRIRVQDIVSDYEVHGQSPDEIAAGYPHITLAQVHAALAYYYDHREDIRREMQEDEQFVAALMAQMGPKSLPEKVEGTQTARDSISS